jgi:hypothetical protein
VINLKTAKHARPGRSADAARDLSSESARVDHAARRRVSGLAFADLAARGVGAAVRRVGMLIGYAENHRRSSNANSLEGQNSAGFPQICAIFQGDNLRRHF